MSRSGATIAWDYLYPLQQRPLLLGYIEDRDLWQFKLSMSREVASALFSVKYDFEEWDKLMNLDSTGMLRLIADGMAIERKHKKDIEELVGVTVREMCIAGYNVPVANLPYTMVSDAATEMSIDHPFAACYWDTATHRCFGLRSMPEGMDVSYIAQQYGGGGHKHASGFKVSREHPLAHA
jgi:oligoribonuclease NrnB/cAMP/cGMP phosphodiesterase (DHH superfamily)